MVRKFQQGAAGRRDRRGASGLTYGILVGLISVVAITAIVSSGSGVNRLFGRVSDELRGIRLPAAVPAGTPTDLYSFTSHTFTTCGANGMDGPAQGSCTSAYSTTGNWDENPSFFTVSGGIQRWVVPQTGTYRIQAEGAQGAGGASGGCNGNCASSLAGGQGAVAQGEIQLIRGEVIQILVGQMGSGLGGPHGNENGGGGGTFVIRGSSDPLVVAGGGGGGAGTSSWGGSCSRNVALGNGQAGTQGAAPSCYYGVAAPTGTNGGNAATSHGGTAGAGLTGNGAANNRHCCGGTPSAAQSFTNGGAGALADGSAYVNSSYPGHLPEGGFGGGGAGDLSSPGGGGGYSGGSIDGNWSGHSTYGGGGGSFVASTAAAVSISSGGRSGHGRVVITRIN